MATTSKQSTRTPEQIRAELAEARSQYQAGAQTMPTGQLVGLTTAIHGLQQELSDSIAAGANPCPVCGNLPHGMERRPNMFEVGCLACLPREVQHDSGKWRQVMAANGSTAAEAVAQWNAQHFVETMI